MNSEIFRFTTTRPPQQAPASVVLDNIIDLRKRNGEYLTALRTERLANSRIKMIELSRTYSQSSGFLDSAKKVPATFAEFYSVIYDGKHKLTADVLNAEFKRIFGDTPAKIIIKEEFQGVFAQIVDSFVAVVIVSEIFPASRAFIVNMLSLFEIVKRLAGGQTPDLSMVFKAKTLLPEGIFPLPLVGASLSEHRKKEAEERRRVEEANKKRALELAAELKKHNSAVKDLISVYERSNFSDIISARDSSASLAGPGGGFTLPVTDYEKLQAETKTVLQASGIETNVVDIAKATFLMEKTASDIAQKLYNNPSAGKVMMYLGNVLLPKDDVLPNIPFEMDAREGVPSVGPCPPAPLPSVQENPNPTMPSGHGEVGFIGISQLMIVEQELLRYELGEIAHIENVMKSEQRSRKHRALRTREETVLTETEETETKEKELSSTERYDLQSESQEVINNTSSQQAGVTVSASYGPSVDVTANYNYASSNAEQESNSSSSNYARETTSRAVNRLEKRTLERRSITTREEIEETNKHIFDNRNSLGHISGIYRWVDKFYNAQIVNYGKRLMLEFVVPEPAAFLRYAMAKQPLNEITVTKPDEPGHCMANGRTFIPLRVQDITKDSYLYWVSKYNVEDITPPPPYVAAVSTAKNALKSQEEVPNNGNEMKLNSDIIADLEVPSGYIPKMACINVYGENQGPSPAVKEKIVVQIQGNKFAYGEPAENSDGEEVKRERGPKYMELQAIQTNKIPVTINSFAFHNYEVLVTVFCTLSAEKEREWQLKTFSAIMNAYNEQKARFDNAVAAAKIREGFGEIMGKNPGRNRETEKIELKKGCISLLTGQRFDLFDAMNRNVGPLGYPEIDFAEAKAESPYIQFFEQAFEWTNMTYIFYPYFWGKKDDWVTLSKLDDSDPLFGKFLQAGAARVQLPVRPNFEKSILHYLQVGEIWNGEGTLVNTPDGEPNPLHVSILEEMKAELGYNNYEGKGKINVTKRSNVVTGTGTEFSENDVDRRIKIGSQTYIIKSVEHAKSIQLRTIYEGESAAQIGYSFGAKLVGDPWEVKIPTSLIKIDDNSDIIH